MPAWRYNSTAKCCTVKSGKAVTSIVVSGQDGVWRLQNMELESSNDVQSRLLAELPMFQPEWNGDFVLVEFQEVHT